MLSVSPTALPTTETAPAVEAPAVSVVIVNYNVREFLEQALNSVARASAGLVVETFVVDNNSVDGSVAMVQERFPEVRVIANAANVGFAQANNQAIREANGRYLLILNPDTLLQEDTLRVLVAFMDAHPEAGAAGCRILNPDGTFAPESRRAFPTPSVALYRMLGLSRLFPKSQTFGRYNLTFLPADEVCEVDALSGSCMVVRREALYRSRTAATPTGGSPGTDGSSAALATATGDGAPISGNSENGGAGLFDESFFMYGEDLDWCYRIQQAGWRVYYTPETQIIHYKGESTRKGELRYVRLFYGAMLQFTEKHFADRHSRAVAGLIRAGIFGRAALSAGGKLVGSLAVPVLDASLALLAAVVAALLWSSMSGAAFSAPYYTALAPAYAMTVALAVALAGGYRRRGPHSPYPVRPALVGGTAAFFLAAASLFFLPAFAFSRAAVVIAFGVTVAVLVGWRIAVNQRRSGRRSALLVGASSEAARLHTLLGRRLDPPLRLVGYVSDGDVATGPVPHLGAHHHLRDLVRLRQIDDVVFAADSLTNTAILGMMRTLHDLPVQFKILTEGQDRIIGKASIDDLSTPLREAEAFVAPVRSPLARRAFEVSVAGAALAARPFLEVSRRARPDSERLRRLAAAAAAAPTVFSGRRALVGFDPTGAHPPPAWGLRPGVVSILDALPERPTSLIETHRAYWFYARNQSAALDAQILLRALLQRP